MVVDEYITIRYFSKKGDFLKKHKIIITTLIFTITLIGLSGCATFDNFKAGFFKDTKDDVTIKIGVYEPMTGVDSEKAKPEIRGIKLANEVRPNVEGKIVELIYSDNASNMDIAETAINGLIEKNPDVILGSYNSAYSMVAGKNINEAKIPSIAITNMNPLVTKNYPYYFRVCYVDSDQGNVLGRYVLEGKKETEAGVLVPRKNDAAIAMATAFTNRIEEETDNYEAIKVYEYYEQGQNDFTKQLEVIKNSGVKSVLLTGEAKDSANIINQAAKLGMDTVFLGDTKWTTPEFKEELSLNVKSQNLAFVNFYTKDEEISEETKKFNKAYQEKYGENAKPEDAEILGYDAYMMAINAIDAAGEKATGKVIRDILDSPKEFQGASGQITFNAKGDSIRTISISTWQKNEIVLLHTITPNR